MNTKHVRVSGLVCVMMRNVDLGNQKVNSMPGMRVLNELLIYIIFSYIWRRVQVVYCDRVVVPHLRAKPAFKNGHV